jgi:DNA replication protein DnaC
MITSLSAIDFTTDIARLTENFTGRQWVFDEIDLWLQESEKRFFILTGEPGVGKSAIALLPCLIYTKLSN